MWMIYFTWIYLYIYFILLNLTLYLQAYSLHDFKLVIRAMHSSLDALSKSCKSNFTVRTCKRAKDIYIPVRMHNNHKITSNSQCVRTDLSTYTSKE